MKSSTAKLPVSRKFYASIMRRIEDACRACSPADTEIVKQAVSDYIIDGSMPGEDSGLVVRLTFSLLRPEIDKAVARSKAARERASKRREAKPKTRAEALRADCEALFGTVETEPPPLDQIDWRLRRWVEMARNKRRLNTDTWCDPRWR